MVSLIDVEVEPGREGCVALVVVGEDLAVGQIGLQGVVEAFDLAVLPGTVRSDRQVAGTDARLRCLDVAREDVVLDVVADDFLDADAVVAKNKRLGPARLPDILRIKFAPIPVIIRSRHAFRGGRSRAWLCV